MVFDENLLNLEVKIKDVDGKSVINVKAELFQDVYDPIVLDLSTFEKMNGQYEHLVNSSVSVCTILTRFKNHPIFKIILKEILKSSNVPTSCPIKKV